MAMIRNGISGAPVGSKDGQSELKELNQRSREIFRQIVESYLSTGEPVGSRNLSRFLPMSLSPASIRNVMADLENLGLIFAPHPSAGRLPTEIGLRLFVDALLEVGDLTAEERRQIEGQVGGPAKDQNVESLLSQASEMISGLSHCAGVVLADKQVSRLKHVQFVRLEPAKALVVLVSEDGRIENRVIDVPVGLPTSSLVEATNFLNHHIKGLTLSEARLRVERELAKRKSELDELTARMVDAGLASWSGGEGDEKNLIVRGQSNLLADVSALADLERIRKLFEDIETKRELVRLLGASEKAEGVRIFIGSENQMFSLSGSSLIVAPFRDSTQKVVGVIGVIGPTRLNYGRIIPMVDFTAKLVSRLVT